jgi:hypothetical protein
VNSAIIIFRKSCCVSVWFGRADAKLVELVEVLFDGAVPVRGTVEVLIMFWKN